MSITFADPAAQTLLARCSYLVLISLVSCARADPPEEFVADPALMSDFTSSLPATGSSRGFSYQIIQGQAILEGDIMLGGVDSDGNLLDSLSARGVAESSVFRRWPDGIVVYATPEESTALQQFNILSAMMHWTESTNIVFLERTEENADEYPNYISFKNSGSCASFVGRQGGEQPVYLSDACSVGSVVHELGHAIGLFHEHTRPDRNGFVTIDYDEIISGREINFDLLTSDVTEYSGYDYGSIMHYGESFFSKSGNPTIIVADGIEIGQREALSEKDIEAANAMYATDLAVTAQVVNVGENQYEIDLSTYNYGNLGANQIELQLRLEKVLEWQDISQNSGWNCQSEDADLICTRDTFTEKTQSLFNVQVSSLSDLTDADLSVRLGSLTQDTDPANNSINDDGVDWDGSDSDDSSVLDTLQTRSVDEDNSPELQEANESTDSDDNNSNASSSTSDNTTTVASSSSTGSSGGGSLSGLLLALLAVSSGLRRTARTRKLDV